MPLIQADLMAFQVAFASPGVSTTMVIAVTDGLLQSLVPSHGNVDWSKTMSMSSGATTFNTWAFLFVASGIKNFKL